MSDTILIFTTSALPMLSQEGKELQFLLNIAPHRDYEVVLCPNAGASDLVRELSAPNRRVVVLHVAAHADGERILWSDQDDTGADLLAEKIRSQGVQLVFINGCASEGQVRFYHEAGVPWVIATRRNVDDAQAFWVATRLYHYLALGRSLEEAFSEAVIDIKLLKKGIDLAPRQIASRNDAAPEGAFLWGLYPRTGDNLPAFSLPFHTRRAIAEERVHHSNFLSQLLFSLADTDTPAFGGIKQLAGLLRRTSAPDETKLQELYEALPTPLGVRIRKIAAEVESGEKEYFRQLLYHYCMLFETLLHQVTALLSVRLWQNKAESFRRPPPTQEALQKFWWQNRLQQNPGEYAAQIMRLLDWARESNTSLPFSETELVELEQHLNSPEFESAATFFGWLKSLHYQQIRLSPAESVETCYLAQQHIEACFKPLCCTARFVMMSVRDIDVVNFRHVPEIMDHHISKLSGKNAASITLPGQPLLENKTILCYPDSGDREDQVFNQQDKLNLFPFVIDRNVFAAKDTTQVDLYLFIGYFPNTAGRPCFQFCSLNRADKIWAFDDDPKKITSAHLLHEEEFVNETHKQNHLLAKAAEFGSYLSDFKIRLLGVR